MPGVKGKAPTSFKEGKLERYQFQNLSPEERKKIAMKGVEARRNKKNERMKLQKTLKALLELPIDKEDRAKLKLIKSIGFEGEDATNQVVLMSVLFKKGLSGDVGAIKEIVDMMERLDLYEDGQIISDGTTEININIQPVKTKKQISDEELEEEIRRIEQGIEDDDW